MKRSAIAIDKFLEGYNCAQSVLYSFCDDLKLDKNIALKIACGFGAGMGRKQEVCGAVTGGIMVIGMKYGRGENQDLTKTDKAYQKTRELMDRFIEKHNTYICRRLIEGCELITVEGQKEFREKELKTKVCTSCVSNVVEILEDIID
ncbi:MAG TPA: C-GCAxxG-C-C family protein [Syntrophorhabdaceae bacterium]|nr:C-GCAxxG-C-C family protein [Syntrophorhabdaceae bacterium]